MRGANEAIRNEVEKCMKGEQTKHFILTVKLYAYGLIGH